MSSRSECDDKRTHLPPAMVRQSVTKFIVQKNLLFMNQIQINQWETQKNGGNKPLPAAYLNNLVSDINFKFKKVVVAVKSPLELRKSWEVFWMCGVKVTAYVEMRRANFS